MEVLCAMLHVHLKRTVYHLLVIHLVAYIQKSISPWKRSLFILNIFSFIPGTVGDHAFRHWLLITSYWSLYSVSFTFYLVGLYMLVIAPIQY